jgi:very-long-chain (3R)-3-hydroxyacyl-CoA dehydratase
MQVASRFALVWGAVHHYPLIAASPAYSSMLLAWSITEVVRYLFFALSLGTGAEPSPLKWMRYSGFFVLYPVGISSELWELLIAARSASAEGNTVNAVIAYATMATYLPGAPMLYTHMMKQRAKVLGGARAEVRGKKVN